MNESLRRRLVFTFQQNTVEIDDDHVLGAHFVHASNPRRVLGLDQDTIGRQPDARVAEVVGQAELVQDVARRGKQLALLGFVHAAAARNASTVRCQRGTTWSGRFKRNVTPDVSVAYSAVSSRMSSVRRAKYARRPS